MKLLPEHVKAALGILSMSRAELAAATGVGEATLWRFDSGKPVREETLWRIQTAFEQRGVIFHNGGKPGVTLDRSKAIIPAK
jgi:hypothetical protein